MYVRSSLIISFYINYGYSKSLGVLFMVGSFGCKLAIHMYAHAPACPVDRPVLFAHDRLSLLARPVFGIKEG